MKNNFFEIIVGTFVLSCAIYFFFFSFQRSGFSASDTYQVSAKFNNIDGVDSGSDVKISGVKIGSVEKGEIDPKTYQAILKLDIKKDVQLPIDSSAKVVSASLLGGKYVSIDVGADDKMLKNNDEIKFTQSSVNFEELLGKFIFSSSSKDNKPKNQ